MTKQDYNDLLKQHLCEVVFTKKNGDQRVMKCTLKQDVINSISTPKHTSRTVTVPDHQVRCVDTEKMEWRSFDLADVISFKVIE